MRADGSSRARTKESPSVGVVVESVDADSSPGRAGIREGDILLGWERAANPPANPSSAQGMFATPMDVEEVCIEESDRGKLTVLGLRSGRRISYEIPPGFWDAFELLTGKPQLVLRPRLDGKALDEYLEGLRLIQNKDVEGGASRWRSLAIEWSRADASTRAVWLWFRLGTVLAHARRYGDAQEAYQAALSGARKLGMTAALKQILCAEGKAFFRQNSPDRAAEAFDEIVQICSEERPSSLWAARALAQRGNTEWRSGRPIQGLESFGKAVEMCEKAAPGGLNHSAFLNNRGSCALDVGDLEAAERYDRTALAILERLRLRDEAGPALTNLGNVLVERGDLAGAEVLYGEALTIAERQSPGTNEEAITAANLGRLAMLRGDLTTAERYHKRTLAIEERINPGSDYYAGSLTFLGGVAAARGDFAAAETFYRRALEILEKLYPESLMLTDTLDSLGGLALRRDEPEAAKPYFGRALEIRDKVAPGGIDTVTSLNGLGDAAASTGELEKARKLYEQALALLDRLSPESLFSAETLHNLGLVHRRSGQFHEAAEFLRRAVAALESQKRKLGGTEDIRSLFAASHADYYQDYIEVLIELGKPEDAFRILERSRARTLLTMLAERDLVFAADIPGGLERERKLTNAEYDKTQGEIRELNPKDNAKEIEKALSRLRKLRQEQEEIARKIREASPRYASLQYPEPLDLAGVQAALDRGTLLLSYSIGRERSHIFVVSANSKRGPPLSVLTLPIGEKVLRQNVEAFRNLIEWNKPSPDLLARGRSLYKTLLKPAEALIAKSDRLLILPDGPLHTLPWAALVRDVKGGQPQYLVEWKPIDTAVSATVYAELKKSRRQPAAPPSIEVAGFGDPRYPKLPEKKIAAAKRGEGEEASDVALPLDEFEEVKDPQLRSVVRGGYRLDPLPASRKEVEQITSLYAPRSAAYLGSDATEEKAKSLGRNIPLIHFACHAILNERFPLDSALVLTIPDKPKEGQDNGLLQAWEIFEKVRIDADLVTLSACESGLGKEMGGEGLIGLTRAFQYAGARSILASLWKVEDQSTAELMKRFYQYLKAGKTKDEALRLAQIDLVHSPNFAPPVHWAAFELIGDWK